MDPRHPELSIERIDELMTQYKGILHNMRFCNMSSALGQMERECGLVVQEICLVAPRLHEAMMQVSRTRRSAIAHGIVESHTDEKVEKNAKVSTVVDEKPVEKPKKKTTRKKKTTKKKVEE